MLAAGEASADLHAAAVIRELKKYYPDAEFFGMGGPEMAACGMECLHDMDALSVMGFTDVLPRLHQIIGVYRDLKRAMDERRPDLFIPVDLPDFNMRLAAAAKKRAVKVLYYVAPQAWAWRRSRARTLGRITDGLAVIFPFEENFFRAYGVDARYVGHPLMEHPPELTEIHWPPEHIALLPGSRQQEIERMLPLMLEAKRIVAGQKPGLSWYLPVAPGIDESRFAGIDTDIRLVRGLPPMDLAMVKSGTAVLEVALRGVPSILGYRTSELNYRIARKLVDLEHIGMPNIVSGREIMPELVQDEFTAEAMAAALLELMNDEGRYREIRRSFETLRASLDRGCAAEGVAQWAASML